MANEKEIDACRDCHNDELYLPFAPYQCIELKYAGLEKAVRILWDKDYRFFKGCAMSPKDISHDDQPKSPEQVIKWFATTQRDIGCHIVGKTWRDYTNEHRCFFYKDKLRLVVSKFEFNKKILLDFLSKYKYDIPHNCCLEVGEYSGGLEVIELNYFAPDGICDPEPLTWENNKYELTYSEDPTWCIISPSFESADVSGNTSQK